MKKLAISFITFNRAKHIKEDLDMIAQPTKDLDIDIYIYDGSTNILTEYVVNKYLENGYEHIYYFHASNSSSKERVCNALHYPEAEYIWLCGDKFVIKPEYYSQILSYVDKAYDIITIYGNILNGTKKFNNPVDFVDYAIVPITHFGSTIIKKNLICSFSVRKSINKNSSFGVQSVYLEAINNCKMFKGIVIDGGNQVNIESFYNTRSVSQSYMWDSWVIDWYKFIAMLPSSYNVIKDKLYNRPDLQMGFFNIEELLRQRSEGQFDWKKYIKCRKYSKKVIIMPWIYIFGISILPQNIAKKWYELKVDYNL